MMGWNSLDIPRDWKPQTLQFVSFSLDGLPPVNVAMMSDARKQHVA
jgi:hypothetical protein